MRYSIKKVTTGVIKNIDDTAIKENPNGIGIIIADNPITHICAVDHRDCVAIDVYGKNEVYPIFGIEKQQYILRNEPIEENKRYAIKVENIELSFSDKIRMISQMKEQGIIPGKLVLYRVKTGVTAKFENTGTVYNGQYVHTAEVNDIQEHLCTINDKEAIDVATNEHFRILKRDEFNHIIDDYQLDEDERHVISIEKIPTKNKVKILSLQHKYKKDKKKSNF